MRKNNVTLKEAMEEMVKQFRLGPGLNEARVKNNWQKVMGDVIAKHTTEISLKRGKLYLKVDSAALKNELTYSKEKIMELFNKELEATVITDVFVY